MTIFNTYIIRTGLIVTLVLSATGIIGATVEARLNQTAPSALSGEDIVELNAPQGSKGWYCHGLVRKNDSSYNLRDIYALSFDIRNSEKNPFYGIVELCLAKGQGRRDLLEKTQAKFTVSASPEWQTVNLPIASFDYAGGDKYMLNFIGNIRFSSSSGKAEIRNIRFIEAPTVKLSCPVRSKAAENGVAQYEFQVKNCSESSQNFRLILEQRGWDGMKACLSTTELALAPGESRPVKMTVDVPARLPAGIHETHRIKAIPQAPNTTPAELEFITVQRVPSPFLLRDEKGWQNVAENIRKNDWAKKEYAETIALADGWTPPTKSGVKSDQGTMGVVNTRYEGKLRACIIAAKLTGDAKYLKKIRDFLLMFSNPVDGYPVLLHATSQGIPQEGGSFEIISQSYDAIRDKLTPAEREQIENTMRLYVDTIIDRMGDCGISNWAIFNQVPAASCALALHDMTRFNALLYEPTGLIDQFRFGTMDDGWWFEMSITYNLHCAEYFTKLALMARPFGIDLLNQKFPSSLTNIIGRHPYELDKYLGMNFQKFGPMRNNMIDFKAMWDGILAYPDYRGIMFGMGDGHEATVSGGLDIAYFAFRDPRYALILKRSSDRDLVYGVGELPENTPETYKESAHSDNAGIAVLRSQNGEMRDRIQLGFKYGTHGGYHGHFDRLSLLCLMRYGRGFWNPESTWYGYGSYLYKWWVQTSLPHNMVIVDGKMQEPTECRPLLFHSGKNLQAAGAESSSRWSNPPYFGGYEQIDGVKNGTERYVPIPEKHPAIGEITGYTEPVFQRRLQIVTDDYVVIADYLRGDTEHVFDNLLQLRGAKPLAGLNLTGHRPQFDASPLSSGQFIVNVEEYDLTAPAMLTSRHHFNAKNKDGKNQRGPLELTDDFFHEPGELMIDAYMLYPAQGKLLLADYPESQSINKRLQYEVKGDGKTLASGTFNAWILGKGEIDVDISGVKELVLSTVRDWTARNAADTLFWTNAVLETREGKTLRLSDLKPVAENLKKQPSSGIDYYGGPVRIAGTSYTDTLAAEPVKEKQPGTLKWDISGLNAIRLKAAVGGDFPAGQEENLRKVVSARSQGKEATFMTLLEPREGTPRVLSARALDAETIEIKLADGFVDQIKIKNLSNEKAAPVIELFRNGKLLETSENK